MGVEFQGFVGRSVMRITRMRYCRKEDSDKGMLGHL